MKKRARCWCLRDVKIANVLHKLRGNFSVGHVDKFDLPDLESGTIQDLDFIWIGALRSAGVL